MLRPAGTWSRAVKVVVIDVGGAHLKVLATGQREPREVASGPAVSPRAWSSLLAAWAR